MVTVARSVKTVGKPLEIENGKKLRGNYELIDFLPRKEMTPREAKFPLIRLIDTLGL